MNVARRISDIGVPPLQMARSMLSWRVLPVTQARHTHEAISLLKKATHAWFLKIAEGSVYWQCLHYYRLTIHQQKFIYYDYVKGNIYFCNLLFN